MIILRTHNPDLKIISKAKLGFLLNNGSCNDIKLNQVT